MTKPGYLVRNYQPSDFENLARLVARQNRIYGRVETAGEFDSLLKRPGFSPEKDMFIAETSGAAVGYAQITAETFIGRVHLRGWIDPPHRRQGLAVRLLELVSARTTELGIGSIQTSVFQENRAAREALPCLGFNCIRRYLDLEIDICAIPAERLDRARKHCRQMQTGEEASLVELQNRAFAGHWGYQPYDLATFIYDINLNNRSWRDIIVFPERGPVTGYCWTETDEFMTVNGMERRGFVNMLGTGPEYRSRGIGRQVLMAGLSHLKDKGTEKVSLSVDSENTTAGELYRSLGFVEFGSTLWYERKAGHETGTR